MLQRISALVGRALASPGRTLEPDVRAVAESQLGGRVGDVQVHTDRTAATSAAALGADAYTVGRHLVFGDNRYAPRTSAGHILLTHELFHARQQQGAARVAPEHLDVAPSSSVHEHAARLAAIGHAGGRRTSAPAPRLPRQVIQLAEAGTYVSTHGTRAYLDAAFAYYRNWGHPNVQRVSTLEDVARDLAGGNGDIDTMRIVSHANPGQLLLGLSSTIAPNTLDSGALALRDAPAFRARVAAMQLISDQAYGDIVRRLLADSTTRPLLAALGVGTDAPSTTSRLGILLRALFETHFLAAVRLPQTEGGGRPNFPGRRALNAFNASRIRGYGQAVVAGLSQQEQAAARQALADLPAAIPRALGSSGFRFHPLPQADANALAQPFGGPGRLDPELAMSISEGAGSGAFLRNVDGMRARITSSTHVEIRGCQIGRNRPWLSDFRAFMGRPGNKPRVSAPDLYQFFFPLNFATYGDNPRDNAALQRALADPQQGLERDARLQVQVRRGDLLPVSVEESGDAFVRRYGLGVRNIDADALKRLNPEVQDWDQLPVGQVLYLRTRQVRITAATGWEDLARQYFNDRHRWPTLWGFNEHIKRSRLQPGDQIFLQSQADRAAFGQVGATPSRADITTLVRGGQAIPAIQQAGGAFPSQPILHVADASRAAALGTWLETQRFDPQGRTAQALTALFGQRAGRFRRTALRLHMNFLSRESPNIVDPIFPDDPRYAGHIISVG